MVLEDDEAVRQLFHCCDTDLGDAILKGHPSAITGDEEQLMATMKQMAVPPMATSIRRDMLLSTKQDDEENIRSFVARLNGKAATCTYTMECSAGKCTQRNDFTHIIVKDVLVAGLADEDIRRDVLGWAELDDKTVDETVNFIEAKEVARHALTNQFPSTSTHVFFHRSSYLLVYSLGLLFWISLIFSDVFSSEFSKIAYRFCH